MAMVQAVWFQKKKLFHQIVMVLFIFFSGTSLLAEDDQIVVKKKEKIKSSFIAAPIIYYEPETQLALGMAGTYAFRWQGMEKKDPPSTVSLVFVYTLKKQILTNLKTDFYFRNLKTRLLFYIGYRDYPDDFYGVGNNTQIMDKEIFTQKSLDIEAVLYKRIKQTLYAGLFYDFLSWNITDFEEDKLLSTKTIPGSEKGLTSGMGGLLLRDTRDNIFYPYKGGYAEFRLCLFNQVFGSSFNYIWLKLDLRKYIRVFPQHILAFQMLFQLNGGDVPFLRMARMGGSRNMRGYFLGRYCDKNMAVFQAEYRFPLVWNFRGVLFAGIGDVSESISKFQLKDFKYSVGLGLRYVFIPDERMNIRLDMGMTKERSRFYFDAFEAF